MSRSVPAGGLHPEIDLPHGVEWELYHNSFSLCSKKVRVCMAELGLPYESHHVHLIETGAYETVRRAYLRINPAGTVPVLVHRGHPVYESHEQIVYAAEHGGENGSRLLPREPARRRLVDEWSDRASLVGNPMSGLERRAGNCIPPLTFPLFATMVAYVPYREIAKGLLSHPNKERPLFFTLLKTLTVRALPKLPPAVNAIAAARRHMQSHLDALERRLDSHGGPWIAGDSYTLADVSWTVILDRLVEADWADGFWGGGCAVPEARGAAASAVEGTGKRPRVAQYWQRLQARPSFSSEIEAVRCEITRKGIEDLRVAKAEDPRLRAALEGTV